MSSILQKARAKYAEMAKTQDRRYPAVVYTEYKSLPVPIRNDFLAPLPDGKTITVKKIDFAKSPIPLYKNMYAVVLDNVLSQEECDELLKMAEMSAGAHGNHASASVLSVTEDEDEEEEKEEDLTSSKSTAIPTDIATEGPPNNGWKPAMVNAGRNHEVLAIDYRNSDRIIWDDKEVTTRLWNRVMQGKGMKEYFGVLDQKVSIAGFGRSAKRQDERWVITEQGLNERMRFLKYGPGQYFKEHCDGTYETPDGSQRSFYTYHIYLNDSAQALGIKEGSEWDSPDLLRGGATTFWSTDMSKRLDVDPKAGRVLIFQHRGLLHSGDEVTQGVKYTVRSDLMYEWEDAMDGDGGIVFA